MTGGNPLLVNVVELRRAVGNQRDVHAEAVVDDVALESCRVEVGSPLRVDLMLEAVSGGISANGSIHGRRAIQLWPCFGGASDTAASRWARRKSVVWSTRSVAEE